MKDTRINQAIDSAAEQAKETMDLLNDKLDTATQCASQTGENLKKSAKKGVVNATDKIEKAVTSTAERIKAKMQE